MNSQGLTPIRVALADRLRTAGWNAVALADVTESSVIPEPVFLAIPPAGSPGAPRLQIYLRRPGRGGRLGAGTLHHISSASASLEGWHVLIITDRGFTGGAFKFAGDQRPPYTLADPEEAFDYLERLVPPQQEDLARQGTQCTTDIVVVGQVTAELLTRLARSRNDLENALQQCDPRFLEELVADNWRREGYEVELVPRSNAGGPDVIATMPRAPVPLKVLTSVKWRRGDRAIKRLDVAELLAWVEQIYPANAGVLATNSRLQSGAVQLIQRFHRLQSMEKADLIDWTIRLWGAKGAYHAGA